MTVYLSGPITGQPDYAARFAAEAAALRAAGYAVLDPAALPEVCDSWDEYMERDLELLGCSEAICFLPSWWRSRGAKIECAFAAALGLREVSA